MATKVKPSRLNITGTPQAGQVPMYVDADNFQWGSAGSSGYGRFLSLRDCVTGQPISFPESTPYTYNTGDYFMVSVVSTATPPVNYKPNGSSYTGTASSTTESDEVLVGDVYVYDGSVWLLQSNNEKTVAFANIAGQPTDNVNLASALSGKLDTSALSDTNYGGAWSGDTTHAATKNAIYTKIHTMDVEIGNKAADNTVVKLSGNQTINGTKTFTTSPVVPSKTTSAGNNGTSIATEAQIYSVAQSVPTKTSELNNDSGFITSASIPTVNDATLTISQGGTSKGTFTANASSNASIDLNTSFIKTQTEYDNLPASKGTDGNFYFIYTADSPTPPTPRTPGANTVLYFPLTSDAVDTIAGVSLSNGGGAVSYTTPTGLSISCAYFSSAGYLYKNTATSQLPTGASARTISGWVNCTGKSRTGIATYGSWSTNQMCSLLTYADGNDEWRFTQWGITSTFGSIQPLNTWTNVILTYDGSNIVWYLNGVQDISWTYTINTTNSNLYLGADMSSNIGSVSGGLKGYLSQVIIEDKCWTAQEVADYYDGTKANYGIS